MLFSGKRTHTGAFGSGHEWKIVQIGFCLILFVRFYLRAYYLGYEISFHFGACLFGLDFVCLCNTMVVKKNEEEKMLSIRNKK
jgi:hypothetical protein